MAERAADNGRQAASAFGIGVIAMTRSDLAKAAARFDGALSLFRKVGDVLGEANCIQRLGDIALAQSNSQAAARFGEAHRLCEHITEPSSIGMSHGRLARLSQGEERAQHVAKARAPWLSN